MLFGLKCNMNNENKAQHLPDKCLYQYLLSTTNNLILRKNTTHTFC